MEQLSNFAKNELKCKANYQFKLDGKTIIAKYISEGTMGVVYELKDAFGNSIAIKIFQGKGKIISNNGAMAEIPLSRRLSDDSVGNVPKFYISNAGCYRINESGTIYEDNPWMIVDFITDNTAIEKNTKSVET